MTKKLVFFDIDDTLLHTTAKIGVLKNGKLAYKLTNQEFNNHVREAGEEYDFSEFRDAEKFYMESIPIKPTINKLLWYVRHGYDVRLLTARADFDSKEVFLSAFRKEGIPIDRIHVHRTGNLKVGNSPAERKNIWVKRYIANNNYDTIKLYDDSEKNLEEFSKLSKEYPDINFVPILVR